MNEALVNLASHPLMWTLARAIRRVDPMARIPGLGVVVSDAACAREILRRDDDFTKNGPGSVAQILTSALGPMALGNMDGDEHRRLRADLADVLAARRAESLVARRAADVEAMCARLARGDAVDLVHFIRGWSGRIAFDVLGIAPPASGPAEASQEIVRLSGRLASLLGFRAPAESEARAALADCAQLASFFREGYERGADPSSLAGRLRSLGFGFDEALGLLLIFVIGGTLTISAALPRIVALLLDSGQFGRLVEDPTRIPNAIDEGLRFVTPLPVTIRVVRRDAVVRGHRLDAGTRLVILTCNLARDRLLYPDPFRFDLSREYSARAGRLWYGAGPHRCPGFNLAQSELNTVLSAMCDIGRALRIVKRGAAIGALLPAYSHLVLQSSGPRP